MPEVCSVDFAVTIHVCLRKSRVHWSPEREQRAEVCAIDLVVDEQVCNALAGIRHRVEIEVRRARSEFARVANAVAAATTAATCVAPASARGIARSMIG